MNYASSAIRSRTSSRCRFALSPAVETEAAEQVGSPDWHAFGRQGGFTLVLVLFLLMVATGVLLDGALRARLERRQASNAVMAVQARAAAQAGIDHGLVRLRAMQSRMLADPIPDAALIRLWNRPNLLANDLGAVGLGGAAYRVEIEDASAKLGLNEANERELVSLFMAIGATFEAAEIAAQSILDWRDPDDLPRLRGAEWDDYYRDRDLPARPRNAPFESVEELAHVRGMESLYGSAKGCLVVMGDGRVNLNSASLPVLNALPGIGHEAATWLSERQKRGQLVNSLEELAMSLSGPARDLLQMEYSNLAQRATFRPQGFEIEAVGSGETEQVKHTIRAVAVPTSTSVEIVRQWEH